MKKAFSQMLYMVMFACLLFLLALLTGCNQNDPVPTIDSALTTEPITVTEPTEPMDSEPKVWQGITAASFFSYTTDYAGTIGDQAFRGVLFQSTVSQPSTTLTKNTVVELRKYARANGYDGLRVYVYPAQENGNFTVGGQTAYCGKWNKIDISLADLDSLTLFKSQSKSGTETYMYFEFIKLPAINATSFLKDVYAFSGTVGGETFDGFVFKSSDYQPTTYFQEYTIDDIKAYALENDFNALRIHCYPIQKDNAFLVGGNGFSLNKWGYIDFSIEHITSEFAFWSQSQGTTENYMWFEFVNSRNPVIPSGKTGPKPPSSPYFTSTKGYAVQKFSGTVAEVKFDGFKFTSSVYQPDFYFTQKAILEILNAAEESGNNFLRIHSYAILKDNSFVVGKQHTGIGKWYTTDVNIADLSTSFRFLSQSQGTTEIYLWFEIFRLDIPDATSDINASYFERGIKSTGEEYILSFYDYAGEAGGSVINGVQIKSGDYQPKFKFTAEGIAAIKTYAKENNANFLKIHSYAILKDNGFLLGNVHTGPGRWNETDIAVDQISEAYTFVSQSQGTTEIFMWFEFYHLDIPDATSQINALYFERGTKSNGTEYILSFNDYIGQAGGKVINGVQIKSGDYQPKFKFTAEGVEAIKEYARQNDVNNLTIHSYAILKDNGFRINGKYTRPEEWATTEVYVEELTEDFLFLSESQGTTEVFLWFEFNKTELISSSSFEGSGYGFSNYESIIDDVSFKGIKATSSIYQPSFKFTSSAIDRIQAYAKANGYTGMAIHSYSTVTNNNVLIGGAGTMNNTWNLTYVDMDDLDTSFTFKSNSEGTTTSYLWFEFVQMPVISRYSFTGSGTPSDFQGTIEDVAFTGVVISKNTYMPNFYFTEAAVADIQAYAEKNGYNTLTIHSYAIQDKNGFVINGAWTGCDAWYSTEIAISEISTGFRFVQQGESQNKVYMWFEFSYVELINHTSFSGTGSTFENYEGVVGENSFTGVKVTGSVENPTFTFTDEAITKIKEYADTNFAHTLQIRAYPVAQSNTFKIGDIVCNANEWTTVEVDVRTLSNSLVFTNVSTDATEIYLEFAFVEDKIIAPGSFSGAFTAESFTGTVGEKEIVGIKMTAAGRKRDAFTAEAIETIKNYAESFGYTELKLQIYVTLDNNAFTVFGQSVTRDQWNEITVSIDSLTTSSRIQTTCTGNTEAYFVFEFA